MPTMTPRARIASMAYCEQVGVKRQLSPRYGDTHCWYRCIMTTRSLPTQHVSFSQKPTKRLGAFAVSHARRSLPRHHNQVDINGEIRTMQTIDFPDVAFHAVAHHGVTNSA